MNLVWVPFRRRFLIRSFLLFILIFLLFLLSSIHVMCILGFLNKFSTQWTGWGNGDQAGISYWPPSPTPIPVLEPSRQKTETKLLWLSCHSFSLSLFSFSLSPSPSLSSWRVNRLKGIKDVFVGEAVRKSRWLIFGGSGGEEAATETLPLNTRALITLSF